MMELIGAREVLDGLEEATANAKEEAISSTKENVVGQPNTTEREVSPVTDQATTDGATEGRPLAGAKKRGRPRGQYAHS
ncbi:hypothetical protein KFL_001710040 [Klebsormidium nitens]|uniref:Uncharacterized protein n=1 Tax=Klebsormidium nitens TaxID=105231 RepID=A0A1Y1HZ90_KLENI|nr:hypothetical protein KFL_001710040 [Klebsormidium nitens]|eukprot:GAQ83974.1 hypothetical protein KFL_001710040 [Klebsormidium nitens]